MKRLLLLFALALGNSAAKAEFRQIDLTIYGMD
jgi:hypothetical protein